MPELPEVQTVRDGLAPVMEGFVFDRVSVNRPNLRFPFPERFAQRLTGVRLTRLTRRAKFLMAQLSSGETLLMHLGMSGRFTIDQGGAGLAPGLFVHEQNTIAAHNHVIFDMSSDARIVYNDPRRFGFMEMFEAGADITRLTHLGPEPLSNHFNGPALKAAFTGKKTKIKNALLDQSIVAGLGNIYVCEALYRARLSPLRAAGGISAAKADSLAAHIKDVLSEAIIAGGSTLKDFASAAGDLGYFQHSFDVYGKEGAPCNQCALPIARVVQSGRSTFYCKGCQRG